ncbi:MAG: hypothetical protein GWO24_12585, partial [Akkermansiaceae bacterium]|nr:hypothetical protein [Akkermansiaceae bacterium]
MNPAANDFHLTAASPARDAADPALPPDEDGSNRDLGRFPYDSVFDGAGSEVRWSPSSGPYRIT